MRILKRSTVEPISEEHKEILKTAKKRYESSLAHWTPIYKKSRESTEFLDSSKQWDTQLQNSRVQAGLPVLTINVLPTFLRQITSNVRMNTPSIQISPADDDSSTETATILEDMIRNIENDSGARSAYALAAEQAATGGIGYWRILSEYENENSFNQKLVFKEVEDVETVLPDENHKNIDGSDQDYCFFLTSLSKDEYTRLYKDSNLSKLSEEAVNNRVKGWGTKLSSWLKEDQVIILEYYYKEYVPATLYKIFNTQTLATVVSTEKPPKELVDQGILEIVASRPTEEVVIKWCKLNEVEVLEETTWPGKLVPLGMVKNRETFVEGKRSLTGLVFDAIDSQRSLNYFYSLQAELVSLAPKTPWVGEVRSFKNFEHLWRDANINNSAYLPYNAVVENGQMLPAPQRQNVEVPIQAAMELVSQARDNIKAIFGVFDSSLGNTGNEISHAAILARQEASDKSGYSFYDNLIKGITYSGRVLTQAIPVFYPDERQVKLLKLSGETSIGSINGQDGTNDLSRGNYSVVVEAGPSFKTRRQNSIKEMLNMGEIYPAGMPLIADKIASASDWEGSKEIAARLRLVLPPAIQQAEAQQGKNPGDAQEQLVQAINQVHQLTSQVQQLQAADQKANELLKMADEELKIVKNKASFETEKAKNDNDIKRSQMMLDEASLELDAKIKLRELDLQQQQLDIEKQKMGINVVRAMSDINGEHHDRTMDHIKNVAPTEIPKDNTGLIGIQEDINSIS